MNVDQTPNPYDSHHQCSEPEKTRAREGTRRRGLRIRWRQGGLEQRLRWAAPRQGCHENIAGSTPRKPRSESPESSGTIAVSRRDGEAIARTLGSAPAWQAHMKPGRVRQNQDSAVGLSGLRDAAHTAPHLSCLTHSLIPPTLVFHQAGLSVPKTTCWSLEACVRVSQDYVQVRKGRAAVEWEPSRLAAACEDEGGHAQEQQEESAWGPTRGLS